MRESTASDDPNTEDAITKDFAWNLAKRYDLKQAAFKLKISPTVLKARCRVLGIRTWPFRIFKSYYAMQKSELSSPTDKEKLQRIMDTSLHHQFNLPEHMDLIIKRARQKVYKHKYRCK